MNHIPLKYTCIPTEKDISMCRVYTYYNIYIFTPSSILHHQCLSVNYYVDHLLISDNSIIINA